MAWRMQIAELLVLCLVVPPTMSCYSSCVTKFSSEMEKAGHSFTATINVGGNSSHGVNNVFCRSMSNQIECLQASLSSCSPQQKTLVQNMLSMFIRPDYQRTCVGRISSTSIPGMAVINPLQAIMPTVPSRGAMSETVILCGQKIRACQVRLNETLTGYMATYNITGICQTLKQFTGCLMTLVTSQCSSLVSESRALVGHMQDQYGSMCSSDAQASTIGMLDCVNRTLQCYENFNTSFLPALNDYNLMLMCQSLEDYSQCAQDIRTTPDCATTAADTLRGITTMRRKNYIYCGDDSGKSTLQCLQRFQDCFSPFNQTFFPALHSANLTSVCSSLSGYTGCVGRLNPTCSQQLSDMIQSAQVMRQQYYQKCHPSVLELSKCQAIGQCTQAFLNNFPMATTSTSGVCGTIGDYFPCVAQSIEQCQISQSATEVSFRHLGTLMKTYCNRLASNSMLLKCPAFVTCTTAVLLSFSPNIKTMFEGSTWCTFMQMSIGCAEHALQSNCFMRNDPDLQRSILELDQLRVNTCEQGGASNTMINSQAGGGGNGLSVNFMDGKVGGSTSSVSKGKQENSHKGSGNGSTRTGHTLSATLSLIVLVMAGLQVV